MKKKLKSLLNMQKSVKRIGILFLSALLVLLYQVPQEVYAEKGDYGPEVYAATYCVIDGYTGEVVISSNKDVPLYPASTTKVMTALIVLEEVEDLDQVITFTETAINIDPSSSTLDPKAAVGEQMKVRDVIYGMLLKSANECGAMLGEFVAGSEEAFAEKMNKKAEELGCTHTHFVNAYGIHHEEHYTSAYDLCLILKAAMENPKFVEIMQNVRYTIPETNLMPARELENGHAMLNGSYPEEGVFGGKTGSTPEAGRVLVTAALQDDFYSISALMKSNNDNFYNDESVILEYAKEVKQGRSNRALTVRERDDTVTPTETVRVRYSPSTKGGICGKVDPGVQLHRKGIINNWSIVDFEGRNGYIYTDFLDFPGKETDTADLPDETDPPTSEESVEETTESIEETSSETETEKVTKSTQKTDSNTTSPSKAVEENTEKESGGFVRFIMDNLDYLLIILAVLIAIVFIILWAMVFKYHRDKKRRLERAYQTARENTQSFVENPAEEKTSDETVKTENVEDAVKETGVSETDTQESVQAETKLEEAVREEPVQELKQEETAAEEKTEDVLPVEEVEENAPVKETPDTVQETETVSVLKETDEKVEKSPLIPNTEDIPEVEEIQVSDDFTSDFDMEGIFDEIDAELNRNDKNNIR